MRIIVKHTEEEVDLAAAREVARQLLLRPESVIGLSTGSTVVGFHHALVRLHRECGVSFAGAVTFNVDEYAGIAPGHPGSCRFRIFEQLLDQVDIRRENCNLPNGEAEDFDREALAYEQQIAEAGGIDLQILGIGTNGHIGFNEPGTPFERNAHVADISEHSLSDKAEFYRKAGFAPRKAITLGIRSIMRSRKILLVAKGPAKREIMERTLFGPVSPDCPASVLQLHPDTIVIMDRLCSPAVDPTGP